MSGESFKIQSYNARIFRVITTDIEKVQIVQSTMKAVGDDKEVAIICKKYQPGEKPMPLLLLNLSTTIRK